MSDVPTDLTSDATPKAVIRDRIGFIWRCAKGTLVTLFVCWHLFFMILRNPLDIWESEIVEWGEKQSWWKRVEKPFEKFNYATWYYGNFTGAEQGWSMFSPPMARWAPFLAAKVYFTDGTFERILSENEPNPTSYFRVGGWRQRKLEDELVYTTPDEVEGSDDFDLYLAWAMWAKQQWFRMTPSEKRTVERIDLIKRWYALPGPADDHDIWDEPSEELIASFAPDGTLLPPPESGLQ